MRGLLLAGAMGTRTSLKLSLGSLQLPVCCLRSWQVCGPAGLRLLGAHVPRLAFLCCLATVLFVFVHFVLGTEKERKREKPFCAHVVLNFEFCLFCFVKGCKTPSGRPAADPCGQHPAGRLRFAAGRARHAQSPGRRHVSSHRTDEEFWCSSRESGALRGWGDGTGLSHTDAARR